MAQFVTIKFTADRLIFITNNFVLDVTVVVYGYSRFSAFDLKKVFFQGGTMPPYAKGSVRVDPFPPRWVIGREVGR